MHVIPVTQASGPSGVADGAAASFGDALRHALDTLDATVREGEQAALALSLGRMDPGEAAMALARARLAVELAVAVRQAAIDAFRTLQQMQV